MKIISTLFFVLLVVNNIMSQNYSTNYILRIDDFGVDNEELYVNIFNIFKKHKAKLLVGVVPFKENNAAIISLTDREKQILRYGLSNGIIEIALHGFMHKNNANQFNNSSEFIGLGLKKQLQLIKEGKEYLEKEFNIRVNVFIPPWNTYDKLTIMALDSLKFKIISGALDNNMPSVVSNIKYLPFTTDLINFEKRMKANDGRVGCVVVLFHTTDLSNTKHDSRGYSHYDAKTTTEFSWFRFEKLIKEVGGKTITTSQIQDLSKYSWENYNASKIPHYSLPLYPVFKFEKPLFFPSNSTNIEKTIKYELYPILFYLLITVISFVLYFYLIVSKSNRIVHIIVGLLVVFVNIVIVYFQNNTTVSSIFVFAISIGILSAAIVRGFNDSKSADNIKK